MRRFWRLGLGLLCASSAAAATEVRMAFGQSLEPYVFEQDASGLEIDIIRAALQAAGHTLRPRFVPQARVPLALGAGEVDAAATLTPDSGLDKVAYSEAYIHYQDYLIAPRGRFAQAPSWAALGRLRIVGFQNAARYLGPEFAAMTRANKRYREQADQLSQARMLFAGHADAIVAERRIFEYQSQRLHGSRYAERPFAVDLFALFDKIPYRVAFREAALRDDFDRGLASIRRDGQLARIESRYATTLKAEP